MKTITDPTTMEIIHVKRSPLTPNGVGDARRKAIARGCVYEGFAAFCGYSYHRTLAAAEQATMRRARAACPGNPPCWSIAKLALLD